MKDSPDNVIQAMDMDMDGGSDALNYLDFQVRTGYTVA